MKSVFFHIIRSILVLYFLVGNPEYIRSAYAESSDTKEHSNARVVLQVVSLQAIKRLRKKLKRARRRGRDVSQLRRKLKRMTRRYRLALAVSSPTYSSTIDSSGKTINGYTSYFAAVTEPSTPSQSSTLEEHQQVVESPAPSLVQAQPLYPETFYGEDAPLVSAAFQAGFVEEFPEINGTTAGFLAGDFSVNEAGSAVYKMDLNVPPGTSGMQPNLAVVYDSRAGNTVLGLGFSLAGLSSISRCPTTKAQDGFVDAVDFDDNDKFCLDGQRLVAIEGAYGENDTIYRTENDTFSRITSKKVTGPGPESWIVETKSGQVFYYGDTPDSRVEASGRADVAVWHVSKVMDSVENYMEFIYNDDNNRGESYPIEIRYTGNEFVGTAPYNKVVFEYEERPDPQSRSSNGAFLRLPKRVQSIKTYAEDQLAWSYNFGYQPTTLTGKSLMRHITECDDENNCLLPTEFEWEHGERGFGNPTKWHESSASVHLHRPSYLSGGTSSLAMMLDMNGDNLPDRLTYREITSNEKGLWVYLNNGSGFDAGTNWWPVSGRSYQGNEEYPIYDTGGSTYYTLIDMNRDGLPDRVGYLNYDIPSGDERYGIWVALNTGSGFGPNEKWYYYVGAPALNRPLNGGSGEVYSDLRDMNGDLLPDRVSYRQRSQSGNGFWVSLNNGNGFDPETNWWADKTIRADEFYSSASDGTGRYHGLWDIDGDTLPDKVLFKNYDSNVISLNVRRNLGDGFGPYEVWINDTNSNHSRPEYAVSNGLQRELIDFNGDGLLDRVTAGTHSDVSQDNEGLWVAYNNGYGFEEYEEIMYSNSNANSYPLYKEGGHGNIYAMLIDLTGDGLPERVGYRRPPSFSGSADESLWVNLNTGGGRIDNINTWSPEGNTNGLDFPRHANSAGSYRGFWDMNGDGFMDRLHYQHPTTNAPGLWVALNKGKPERITTFRTGHGHETTVEYSTLMDPEIYTKDTDAVYPVRDIYSAMTVVKSYSVDDGVGGKAKTSFVYTGLKAHAEGLGMCGFRKIEITNELSSIKTVTYYRQDHPFKSLPFKILTYLADGTLIKEVEDSWAVKNFDHGTYFPYVESSDVREYNIDGSMMTRVNTHKQYDDYGNVTRINVNPTGPHSFVTINEYKDPRNTWFLDRLERSTVRKIESNQSPTSKVVEFYYDRYTGLLVEEVSNVGDPLELTKSYRHDFFGNIEESTTYSNEGELSQYTYYDTSDDIVQEGQFAYQSVNAKGHIERKLYDKRHGKVSWLTGPNGLVTQWQYDAFGRVVYEVRSDFTQTRTLQMMVSEADQNAPEHAVYYIRTDVSGAAPTIAYYDLLDREIRRETVGFDGTPIFVDSVYNSEGELEKVSDPYFSEDSPIWTVTTYDDLGRPIEIQEPGADNPTTIGYESLLEQEGTIGEYGVGVRTTTVNPLGQTEIREENTIGQLTKVTDSLSGTMRYVYDPDGNAISVFDPAGNETRMEYDVLGNKVWISDPDSGISEYRYNQLGQLVWQKDAKQQETTYSYDSLGRMDERVGPEGTTLWDYDIRTRGIGKLAAITSPDDHAEEYYYDDRGRIEEVITTIADEEFITRTFYDEYSRVWKMEYPRYVSGRTFRTENIYNEHGYLKQVFNQRSPEVIYWTADVVNARGQLEQSKLGNGLVTNRRYDSVTGFLSRIQTNSIQDLRYTFDILGNLREREDVRQCAKEQLTYDRLNRLTRSVVRRCGDSDISVSSGGSSIDTVRLRYDRLGNILMKSDVGIYTYGENGAGPHAVTSIIGSKANVFSYDLNGNRINDNFGTVDYTPFNKPSVITKGNKSVEFSYSGTRARYRQIQRTSGSITSTKYYVGGLYELELAGTNEKEKFFIRSGEGTVAIHIRRNDAPDKTLYLLKDHLNSIQTITNELGAITEILSFDAWGKRRNQDWSPAQSQILSELDRGFTGHEQLDTVGLIHMNGRVYDPELGRFLSPDPFVQAPENTQSYNRYSYVLNNPLSYTDPSGFFFKKFFKKIKKAFKKVVRFVKRHKAIIAAAVIGLSTGLWVAGLTSKLSAVTSAVLSGAAGGAAGSFSAAVVSGARFSDALKAGFRGGVFGGLSAGIFDKIGANLAGIERVLAHGAAGGTLNLAQGGKFEHGFISSIAAASLGDVIGNIDAANEGFSAYRTAVASLVGGVVAEASGGKFANGAITAAFARIFNEDGKHEMTREEFRKELLDMKIDGRLSLKLGTPERAIFNLNRIFKALGFGDAPIGTVYQGMSESYSHLSSRNPLNHYRVQAIEYKHLQSTNLSGADKVLARLPAWARAPLSVGFSWVPIPQGDRIYDYSILSYTKEGQ